MGIPAHSVPVDGDGKTSHGGIHAIEEPDQDGRKDAIEDESSSSDDEIDEDDFIDSRYDGPNVVEAVGSVEDTPSSRVGEKRRGETPLRRSKRRR